MRHDKQRRRPTPRFPDRLELWLSAGHTLDGVWVGTFRGDSQMMLPRVDAALGLIKAHDRRRYDRLTKDLARIWVRLLPGVIGRFTPALEACELDERFVQAETTSSEMIATVIVHEATHARLVRCGIRHHESLRPRVEAVCLHQELAFAARLPNGGEVREQAEQMLIRCACTEEWTDAAYAERYAAGMTEIGHHLGVSGRTMRVVTRLRELRLRLARLARGVARRGADRAPPCVIRTGSCPPGIHTSIDIASRATRAAPAATPAAA